jgi:hypothetical protein
MIAPDVITKPPTLFQVLIRRISGSLDVIFRPWRGARQQKFDRSLSNFP